MINKIISSFIQIVGLLELSQGELVAFHDSDDIWHQDKLEKQIKAMETSGADLVFCKLVKYCANGKTQLLPDSISEGFLNPVENLFGIGTQSLLAKKEVFEKCPFDISMPRFQEFEMLVRIAEKYRIYCLDDGLVDYKIGNDSISSNPEKLYKACDLILQKHPSNQVRLQIKIPSIASKFILQKTEVTHHAIPSINTPINPLSTPHHTHPEERIWAERQPRVPDAPRSGTLSHMKIYVHRKK